MDRKTTVTAGLGLGLFTWYALTGGNLIMQSYTAAKQGLGMAAETKRGCGCNNNAEQEQPRLAQGSRGRNTPLAVSILLKSRVQKMCMVQKGGPITQSLL